MKDFKAICKMDESTLKAYLDQYLTSKGYITVNEDGFLYARGTVPVLVVAHLDTVHKEKVGEIHDVNGRISSPQGIGGDDRCGVFIIMNLIKELNCSVLFCEKEEVGCVGAIKFTKATCEMETSKGEIIESKYVDNLDVNYIVEFDRRGNKDAVFYSCDNKDFTKFITETTGFKEEHGSFTDISRVAPAAGIAAVNLSSGYYNAHTTSEYVEYKDMMNTLEVAKKLIATESEAYEYIEKKTSWRSSYDGGYSSYFGSKGYGYSSYGDRGYRQQSFDDIMNSKDNPFKVDLDLELEVVWEDIDGAEYNDIVTGSTKAECWVKFFMQNPDVSFSMLTDYSFM